MAQLSQYAVTFRFRTRMDVNVQRTVTLTDTYRSNAVARALRVAVPQGATDIVLVKANAK